MSCVQLDPSNVQVSPRVLPPLAPPNSTSAPPRGAITAPNRITGALLVVKSVQFEPSKLHVSRTVP